MRRSRHQEEHEEESTWTTVVRGRRDDKENDPRTSRRVEINDDSRQRRSYREHLGDEVYAGTVGRTQFTVYRGDERSRMGTMRKEEDEMSRKVDSPRMEAQGRPPLGATENRVTSRRTDERQYEDNREAQGRPPLGATENRVTSRRTDERQYEDNRDKYERMREMRQRDNEERTRRMKEETRERDRDRELDPREMRKRARSSSRGREGMDRRVKFKPERARTRIAIISDSQLKHVTLDEGLEELWVRKGWDSSVAIMRGMNARHVRELATKKTFNTRDCDVVILSVGSNDLQYYKNQDEVKSREEDIQRRHQNDLLLEDVTQDIMETVRQYAQEGKDVYWIAPPLHAWRDEEAYALLEDSIRHKGREIRNMEVIGIAGMMTEAILHSTNRREAIERYVGDRDVNHLNAAITREILLDITRKYEGNCDVIPGAKATNLIRREDLQRGRCWACNEGGHETRECGRRERLTCEICEKNGHVAAVCMLQYRMCHYCGRKGQHSRKNCQGWWGYLD